MTLKSIRKSAHLTQKRASEIVEVPLRTYVEYEKDEEGANPLKLERMKEILMEYAAKDTSILKDKVLLITGGTGSFGHAVVDRFLDTDVKEIRILSRDEKKQDDMRKAYNNEKLKFYIGDVRNLESIIDAFKGVDYVFSAAALKQVPSCEFYPMEAVRTNVIGSDNVITACVRNHVKKAIGRGIGCPCRCRGSAVRRGQDDILKDLHPRYMACRHRRCRRSDRHPAVCRMERHGILSFNSRPAELADNVQQLQQ